MDNNEGDIGGNSGTLQSVDMLNIQNSMDSEQAAQFKQQAEVHQKQTTIFMDETMAAQSADSIGDSKSNKDLGNKQKVVATNNTQSNTNKISGQQISTVSKLSTSVDHMSGIETLAIIPDQHRTIDHRSFGKSAIDSETDTKISDEKTIGSTENSKSNNLITQISGSGEDTSSADASGAASAESTGFQAETSGSSFYNR